MFAQSLNEAVLGFSMLRLLLLALSTMLTTAPVSVVSAGVDTVATLPTHNTQREEQLSPSAREWSVANKLQLLMNTLIQ